MVGVRVKINDSAEAKDRYPTRQLQGKSLHTRPQAEALWPGAHRARVLSKDKEAVGEGAPRPRTAVF